MNKIIILLILVSNYSFSQQKGIKPKIMIIPSNSWMTENGFVEIINEQGSIQKSFNYSSAFDNDPILNSVINSTGGKFAERGFYLTDMQQSIKIVNDRIEKNNITGRSLNILDELALEVSADIILELDFNIKDSSLGRKIVDRFSMTVKDTYTGETLGRAGMPGSPSSSESIELLVLERVEAFISELETDVLRIFDSYVNNGRSVKIEVILSDDVLDYGCFDYYETKLTDDLLLFEYFENWVYENGFKGVGTADPSPSGESINLLINIPLVDNNGKSVKSLDYATKFLRDTQLRNLFRMRPEQVGLGHVILNILECK